VLVSVENAAQDSTDAEQRGLKQNDAHKVGSQNLLVGRKTGYQQRPGNQWGKDHAQE
jgi:hypothetical protein